MPKLPKKLQKQLDERSVSDALRQLGQTSGLVDFSSNDYLGFAKNETLFSKTFQLLLNKNITTNGSTGSRLLNGNHTLYALLEKHLAEFHESESALVFNSGYDANIGFFSCVPQRGDFVFYDEWVHASIRDGISMGHAKSYKFQHNSLEDLKTNIDRTLKTIDDGVEVYVVTESVFSMDGDSPDLVAFSKYCTSKGYHLVVDEAHAVGVFGANGEGLVQQLGLQEKLFARTVTFGKALGAHGAVILGSNALQSYLVNFARSFIYSTALSPHSIATIQSAYEYLSEEGKKEQELLKEHIAFFKKKVRALKLEEHFIPSDSAIHSCIVKGNAKAKEISRKLMEKGFDVKAILSPTVPEGQERLRCCLHSYNSKEELGLLLELLSRYL